MSASDTQTTGISVRLEQQHPFPIDAQLDCGRGQVLGLVGPSGAGKSTILRCIAGLHKAAAGKVSCGGKVWLDTASGVDLPPQKRRVGMVFQQFALFPHLPILDQVAMALGDVPKLDRRARALELLARVHLDGLGQRLPRGLSGGQQQRAALARALAREPQVLLLDEPFSAVDQVTRRKLRLEMAQLKRDMNMPIILVTHDLDEACMLADELSVLHNGRTLQQGLAHDVIDAPANATVARLVDVRNLFDAEIIEHAPGSQTSWLAWEGHRLECPYLRAFAPGDRVCWCIGPAQILLHRRVQPSRGVRENPIRGSINDIVTIGGISSVIMEVKGRPGVKLNMDLPPHVVHRNALKVGEEIGVSLLKNALHIMPWQAS